jgi:hypothetical protein
MDLGLEPPPPLLCILSTHLSYHTQTYINVYRKVPILIHNSVKYHIHNSILPFLVLLSKGKESEHTDPEPGPRRIYRDVSRSPPKRDRCGKVEWACWTQDKARQDHHKTRHDKTRQDKTRHNTTGQDATRHNTRNRATSYGKTCHT